MEILAKPPAEIDAIAQGRTLTQNPKKLRSEESVPSTPVVKHVAKKPRVRTPKSGPRKKETKTMTYSKKAAAIKMAVYPDIGIFIQWISDKSLDQ